MFANVLAQLPQADVRRVLILRTAATPQVQWTIEQLKSAYPGAEFSILGKQLDHPLFAGMYKFEITKPWLTPASYRPLHGSVGEAHFDLAVMCLNSDSGAGYEHVSRVMKQIPAAIKLVAGYTKEWYEWQHGVFREGNLLIRWAAGALECILLPLVYLLVAAMPAGKTYMPEGQGRPAPGYDR